MQRRTTNRISYSVQTNRARQLQCLGTGKPMHCTSQTTLSQNEKLAKLQQQHPRATTTDTATFFSKKPAFYQQKALYQRAYSRFFRKPQPRRRRPLSSSLESARRFARLPFARRMSSSSSNLFLLRFSCFLSGCHCLRVCCR